MSGAMQYHSPLAPSLTRREAEALEFIKTQLENHGVAPALDELGAALGMKAKSHVHRIVHALEAKGLIRILPRRARAIELVHSEDHYSADCDCMSCADRRHRDALKFIDAVKRDAPDHFRFSKKANLRRLSMGKRAGLLGVSIQSLQSTGSKAAALRTRTRAIPAEVP